MHTERQNLRRGVISGKVQFVKCRLSSLASTRDACARLEMKNGELMKALEREREARAVAERHLVSVGRRAG